MSQKILFVFFDGIALGETGSKNPFSVFSMPFLENLLQKKLVANSFVSQDRILLKGIDACLGTDGLPQSATGQTTLLTGINAAKLLGYHLPAYPNQELTELIYQENVLKKVTEIGYRSTFANAYDINRYNRLINEGKLFHSATTLSVLSLDQTFRTLDDLSVGKAVYWDITNAYLQDNRNLSISLVEPEEAGTRLSSLLLDYEFVLFECFMPDVIGHAGDTLKAQEFLGILDRFIHGILTTIPQKATLVVSSDHGNFEDLSSSAHTKNPVPLLAIGEQVNRFRAVESIMDLRDCMLSIITSE
ncbi:phosphoglyceromutase [Chlamydiota bacterium]